MDSFMKQTFTPEQIADFRAYVRVQESGRYNMLTPNAVRATGLGQDRHFFVIENYDALEKAAAKVAA